MGLIALRDQALSSPTPNTTAALCLLKEAQCRYLAHLSEIAIEQHTRRRQLEEVEPGVPAPLFLGLAHADQDTSTVFVDLPLVSCRIGSLEAMRPSRSTWIRTSKDLHVLLAYVFCVNLQSQLNARVNLTLNGVQNQWLGETEVTTTLVHALTACQIAPKDLPSIACLARDPKETGTQVIACFCGLADTIGIDLGGRKFLRDHTCRLTTWLRASFEYTVMTRTSAIRITDSPPYYSHVFDVSGVRAQLTNSD